MSDLLDDLTPVDDDLAQLIHASKPDPLLVAALEESQTDDDALLEASETNVDSEWLADATDGSLADDVLEASDGDVWIVDALPDE